MKRSLVLGWFVLLCLAQLAAAASGIARFERTLSEGASYRFRCAPVDPEDPFRGRYVQLRFAGTEVEIPLPAGGSASGKVYALLGVDPSGFAVVTELRAEAPASGDYLYVSGWSTGSVQGNVTRLSLPFDRYYMEESKAPAVEAAYRQATRRGGEVDAWVTLRVLDGLGVIEQLVIDGHPVGG